MLIERIAPIAQDLNGKRIITTTDRDEKGNVVASRVYEIEPGPDGRLIFEVENEDDIGTFLSIKEGYRMVKASNAPKTVKGGLTGGQGYVPPKAEGDEPEPVVPESDEPSDDEDDVSLDDVLDAFSSTNSLYNWALETYDIKLDKRLKLRNMKQQLKERVGE